MGSSLSTADASYVTALVQRRSAVVLDDTKLYLLETRLGQLAKEQGFADPSTLIGEARRGQAHLETKIVEAMVTHETSFFRDARPFDVLRREVLPRLVAARQERRRLTIWSAACSSGQEPYSLAMVLLESFPEVARWPARIIATDLSEQVLERARNGAFHQIEVNRGLPATLLLKYFERKGAEWRVKQSVRDLVEFKKHNLLDPIPIDWRPDVVFLRNVLIYFNVPTKREILGRVRGAMAPDGVLVLGGTETTIGVDDTWAREPFDGASCYRVTR